MPVIPTLTIGPVQILKEPQDLVLYLLRSALLNPGFTSSNVEEEIVSFRKLEAQYGKNGNELASQFEQALNMMFLKYFNTDNLISASVSYKEISETKYKLEIEITDNNGVLKIIKSKVDVENENDLIIHFELEN